MPIVACPGTEPHNATCFCGGTGQVNITAASSANAEATCERCGDPDRGYAAQGNVTIDENGVYVGSACPSCNTLGLRSLVMQLNKERCPCRGMGCVDVLNGHISGRACERCGSTPDDATLAKVREYLAA